MGIKKSRLSIIAMIWMGIVHPAAFAQDSAGRTELRRADLSGAPNMEVILSVTELKPGGT